MDLVSSALAALTALLVPLVPAAAAGLSVVLLTMGVRLLLLPVGIAQVRAEKVRARIGPELARIGARHRDDPQKMVAEQRKVYSEAGTSPFAGCLPALVQMPVVLALYGVFTGASEDAGPLLSHTFGGVELGSSLLPLAQGMPVEPVFALLIAFLALVAWAQRSYVVLPATLTDATADGQGRPAMPGILTYMSYVPVAIAAFVPLAAGLYLLVSTAWALGERLVLRRLLPERSGPGA